MHRLAITLLGPPQVRRDGELLSFDTRKAVALLAFLAGTARPHSREALAALFWPEYADARNALRRTLSALQSALGPGWLDTGRETVALPLQPNLWLDSVAFESQIDVATDRSQLAAAVALYQDDFMAGFTLRDSPAFDEWQFFEAERLRGRLAQALERLAELQSAAGDVQGAIDAARRRLGLDPLHEPAHRALMTLYARAGQRSAALRQYRECARLLERELGVAPLDETIQLYEHIRTTPAEHAPRPLAPLLAHQTRSTQPLVGREAEQERLRAAYTSARSGALVVIEGQPGIGKTRLADDLREVARAAGAVTLTVRCYERETELAYAPLAGLLREAVAVLERSGRLGALRPDLLAEAARLVPALGGEHPQLPALTGADARRRFFEAIADVLLAACDRNGPALLFIDDAHWADGASLDVLAFLARRLRGHSIVLLLTWRDTDVPPDHSLRVLLAEARREGAAHTVTLAPLDVTAIEQLVQLTGGAKSGKLAARLHRESGGLPLLAVEYLAALREGALVADGPWPLPERARDLLEARLRPLSELARQILTAAAAVGRDIDLATLCAAAAMSEDDAVEALEELLARGVLHEVSAAPLRFAFGHERLRALSYERTSQLRRRVLHRRIGVHLAELCRHAPRPGLLAQAAHHHAEAGENLVAADLHRLAGDEARALAANSEAVAHYSAALALGHPDAAGLHHALGDLRALAGSYPRALEHYAAAHITGPASAAVLRKIGEIHHRLGEWDAAETHYAAALAEPRADAGERAATLAAWSLTARRRGHTEHAASLAAEALTLAETAGEARVLARAHGAAGAIALLNDRVTALQHLEHGLVLAQQVDDPETRIAALNSLALALADEDPAHAIALAETALELCLARDDRHRAAALHNTLADLRHATGEREAALAHLREAVALFAAIGHDQPAIWMLTEW
jgi:DNA-binding SARP family transcriptional activator